MPWGEIALLVAALVVGGLLTGFLAGLLGIGGGGVLVPILYELFGVVGVADAARMHVSVATSLAVIIPTSIRSFQTHRAKGAVDQKVLELMGPPVFLGVLIGILVAGVAGGWLLRAVFAGLSALMAAHLLAGGRWKLGADLPGANACRMVASFIGLNSTLVGIGGGAQMTAFMTLYGRAIHQSVATASGLGPIIAIPAALGYVWAGWGVPDLPYGSLGYVSLLGAALVIPTSVWAAPWGARTAHDISRRSLELAFAVFLAVMAVRFGASLLT